MSGCQTLDRDMELVALAIYREIRKQCEMNAPSCPTVSGDGGMRNVLIEGQVDLLKVAAVLTRRFGSRVPDIETVEEN